MESLIRTVCLFLLPSSIIVLSRYNGVGGAAMAESVLRVTESVAVGKS